MKQLIFIFLLLSNYVFAQTDNYKAAISNFEQNYNDEKYEEIFNSFSPEMQEALPLESTRQFLTGLKMQAGKIENKEFVGFQQGTYATYKTRFERMILAVNISLDTKNLINGLFIKPYEAPVETATAAVNTLNSYPKEFAEILFRKAKEFPDNTQLSVAVVQNGNTNYYGIIKTNDTIRAIANQNKVFEIGSLTKVFTATVLASLVEDKKLKLSDEINAYYTFPFDNASKISFESLANHTSGLPRLPDNLNISDNDNPYKNYGKVQIEEYLRNQLKIEQTSPPAYAYSNLGTGLLGYSLGLSQKTSFQKLLQKRVFDKYGMKDSFTNVQNLENKLVKGQNAEGKLTSNWDFDVLFGAGGILSTSSDLAKFAKAQFNAENKELALTRKPTFKINDSMEIGLGWHVLKSETGKDLIWHNGGTGGYSSSMTVNVSGKKAVIVLSNLSAFHPKMENIDQLGFELMNKVD